MMTFFVILWVLLVIAIIAVNVTRSGTRRRRGSTWDGGSSWGSTDSGSSWSGDSGSSWSSDCGSSSSDSGSSSSSDSGSGCS